MNCHDRPRKVPTTLHSPLMFEQVSKNSLTKLLEHYLVTGLIFRVLDPSNIYHRDKLITQISATIYQHVVYTYIWLFMSDKLS